VQGNRQLLAQLLTKLIENGLKYVPAGGRIEVAVRRLSHGVRLTVSDNGPGIARLHRGRLELENKRTRPAGRRRAAGLASDQSSAGRRPEGRRNSSFPAGRRDVSGL
jgi:signal transduction histidine kinase